MEETDKLETPYSTGKKYFLQGNYKAALESFLKELEQDSQNVDAVFELGKTYYFIGEYLKAVDYLKQSLTMCPNNAHANLMLAKCYIMFNNYNLALLELKKACALSATGEIYQELGLVYEALGDYHNSVEAFKKATAAGIDTNNLHFQIGRAYREIGEQELSIKEFEKLRFSSPYNESAFYKNKLINEIEISQRKIVIESKPTVLGIALTHNCNIKCRMCRYWSDPWDVPENIIKEVMELFPYLRDVYWQGGEPFFSRYFEELFEKASVFPTLLQTIVTNGLLIDDKWAKKLIKSNVNIIWSIDSQDKRTYEYIREGARFEELIDRINIVNKYRKEYSRDNAVSAKLRIIMQSCIMKYNYQEVERLVDFAKTNKFDAINIIPIRNVTEKENIFYHNDSEAIGYLQSVLPQILKKYEDHNFKITNQLPISLAGDGLVREDMANMQIKEKTGGSCINADSCLTRKDREMLCYWPWKSLFLLYKGTVRPYGFCESNIGDINAESLKDIWNGRLIQEYRERILNNINLERCSTRCTSGIMSKDSLKLN